MIQSFKVGDRFDIFNVSDRWGYYKVGPYKIHKKWEAIKFHESIGSPVDQFPTWHYHDEVFGSYDWTKEPTESLEELYAQRARQIREKYDYIALFFSGGADSTNMLRTFLKNKIHIDEIVIFHYLEGSRSKKQWLNSEAFYVALPFAQKVVAENPEIKLRLIDFSQRQYDYFRDMSTAETWLYNNNTCMQPAAGVLNQKHMLDPFYLDYINSGKSICFLQAMDKPRVFVENNRWFFRFIDTHDTAQHQGVDCPSEFFYWTPDLPKLLIKQAHVIKRYFENANENTPFCTTIRSGQSMQVLASKPYRDGTLWLTNHGVDTLMYKDWDWRTYSVGKPWSMVIHPRDTWFMNMSDLDPAKANWKKLLQKWWSDMPEIWKNDPNDMSQGMKCCVTRPYYLN